MPNNQTGPRPRIESLSDLIFGLALSLSAYSLLTRPPSTLIGLATDLMAFTFSFMILISVWLRYTGIMSVLPLENRTTKMLNVAMLFAVALVPYLFNLVSLYGHPTETVVAEYASIFFAIDMAALVFILAFFIHELTVEERQLINARTCGTLQKSQELHDAFNFSLPDDDSTSILAMESPRCSSTILSVARANRRILDWTTERKTKGLNQLRDLYLPPILTWIE